jgi:hypothetical protein
MLRQSSSRLDEGRLRSRQFRPRRDPAGHGLKIQDSQEDSMSNIEDWVRQQADTHKKEKQEQAEAEKKNK